MKFNLAKPYKFQIYFCDFYNNTFAPKKAKFTDLFNKRL
ncbi:hypothetical protein CCS77_0104 [Campylobacter concisus]|uniref:Uncharacterized protein n=1 Tax=Campylobacter concisus TaxID=199 RepID=A0A2R4NXM8_9BACT|nr:hypothetical protein CCS77_0104 [Campylobacter concisus]